MPGIQPGSSNPYQNYNIVDSAPEKDVENNKRLRDVVEVDSNIAVEKKQTIETKAPNQMQLLESVLNSDGSIYLKEVMDNGTILERILLPTNSVYSGQCQKKSPMAKEN